MESEIGGVLNLWAFPPGLVLTMPKTKVPIFYRPFFAEKEVSAWLRPPHKIFLPVPPVLLIGKRLSWAGRCRAEGIERVEDLGPEPRNVG